jgi:hypothetical protein
MRVAIVGGMVAAAAAVQIARPAGSGATAVPTGSYVVSGTLANGAGAAVPQMPVSLYATDVALDGAVSDAALPLVAATKTDASGHWAITVPSPLPSTVQAMADTNGGILNVEALSAGTAPDGTAMVAVHNFSLTSTTTSMPSGLQQTVAQDDAQPIAETFYPVKQNADTAYDDGATIDDSANKSYLADSDTDYLSGGEAGNQTSGPTTDELETLNGTSYAHVLPAALSVKCNSPVAHVVKRRYHVETPVSEAHGYADATGEVRLGTEESQTYGLGISYDNSVWKLDGTTSMGHSWGSVETKDEPGPQHSNQVDVPMDWIKQRHYIPLCDGTTLSLPWTWRALKFDPGPGQASISLGKSVIDQDGPNAYANSAPSNRLPYGPNSSFAIIQRTSMTYSFTAGIFPLRLTAYTAYDTTRQQGIFFGPKHDRLHWIWGANHRPDQGAKVFDSW